MATFKRDLAKLQESYDVLIVGGGISGAWLALHAAQSGYKTALIEQFDFASQTSSSSSKLLHGGIRYLQQFQFGKVRESALERAHYIHAAPHLSVSVPFLVPTYKDLLRSKLFLLCGMLAYRFLTLGENKLIGEKREQLPPISSLSRQQLQDIIDLGDEPHTGAVQFYERHMVNSERMVLSILRSAAENGAEIANYCTATSLLREQNKVVGVNVRDELKGKDFEIRARMVINAAGPWIDELNTQLDNKQASINGFAIGSHIITRKISDRAIAITTKHQSNAKLDRGGRHVFIIPWNGYSLIGTSYDEIDKPERNLAPTEADVEQLLDAVNDALPNAKLSHQDLISGYSGLYPLRTEDIQSTVYQGSGEYVIIDHEQSDNVSGLVTALGAKYTTGRKLSALTMKCVHKKLGGNLNLEQTRLKSSRYDSVEDLQSQLQLKNEGVLPDATVAHLSRLYGSETFELIELAKNHTELAEPICSTQPDIVAQLVFALEQEQAQTLEDLLFRRTSVGFFGISDNEIESVASLVAKHLDWPEDYKQSQLSEIKNRLLSTKQVLSSAANKEAA